MEQIWNQSGHWRESERIVKDEWVFQKGLREEKEEGRVRERDVR